MSRVLFEDVKKFFEKHDIRLLTEENEFDGCKKKLRYLCSGCEEEKTIRLQGLLGRNSIPMCIPCSRKRCTDIQKEKNGGKYIFQTEEFLKNREALWIEKYGGKAPICDPEIERKRKQFCLEKYGVEYVFQAEEIKEKSKQSNIEKRGVEYPHQCPDVRQKFLDTLQERHGANSLNHFGHSFSKESQKLFWEIYALLSKDEQEKTYFGELNQEFVCTYERKNYKYDFTNSLLKKIIEYNGSKFHPKEEQNEEEIGWCVFSSNKTVKEAREYEAKKFKGMMERGYEILVVWDYEVKENSNGVIKTCLKFLNKKEGE